MNSNVSVEINPIENGITSAVIEDAVFKSVQLLAASARALFRMGSKDAARLAFETVAPKLLESIISKFSLDEPSLTKTPDVSALLDQADRQKDARTALDTLAKARAYIFENYAFQTTKTSQNFYISICGTKDR